MKRILLAALLPALLFGAGPAVANAIVDALAPFGVTHLEMPFKPEKLWRLMQEARQ